MQSDNSPFRVLIVDDNPAIHKDIAKILGIKKQTQNGLKSLESAIFSDNVVHKQQPDQFNFHLDSAYQGEEAVNLVEKARNKGTPYSLAFVDVRMPPGINGIETLKLMWTVDTDIQAVICTAYSDYSWEEIIATLGIQSKLLILKKPFDPAEINQIAYALVEKWRLLQQNKTLLNNLKENIDLQKKQLTAQTHDSIQQKLQSAKKVAEIISRTLNSFSFK